MFLACSSGLTAGGSAGVGARQGRHLGRREEHEHLVTDGDVSREQQRVAQEVRARVHVGVDEEARRRRCNDVTCNGPLKRRMKLGSSMGERPKESRRGGVPVSVACTTPAADTSASSASSALAARAKERRMPWCWLMSSPHQQLAASHSLREPRQPHVPSRHRHRAVVAGDPHIRRAEPRPPLSGVEMHDRRAGARRVSSQRGGAAGGGGGRCGGGARRGGEPVGIGPPARLLRGGAGPRVDLDGHIRRRTSHVLHMEHLRRVVSRLSGATVLDGGDGGQSGGGSRACQR